jgi:hypothetical protein
MVNGQVVLLNTLGFFRRSDYAAVRNLPLFSPSLTESAGILPFCLGRHQRIPTFLALRIAMPKNISSVLRMLPPAGHRSFRILIIAKWKFKAA